jgi:cytochrome c-type biogenesis protein CcmE
MDWITVKSSSINRYAYTSGVLTVEYSGGEVYDYAGVPPDVFAQLQAATSKGQFIRSHIKPNYRFSRRSGVT